MTTSTEMSHWYKKPGALLAAAGLVAGMVGIVATVAFGLGYVGIGKPVPKFYDVSKSDLSPGDRITIPGERLDLVSQVYLASDLNNPIQLTYATDPRALQLVVTIPEGLDPGRYNLRFKTTAGETRSTQLWLTVISGSAPTTIFSITVGGPPPSSTPQQPTAEPTNPAPAETLAPPTTATATPPPTPSPSLPRRAYYS